MEKCNHEKVSFYEQIPAEHQRHFEGNDYFCNNEYVNGRIKAGVKCNQCGIHLRITSNNQNKLPEWVRKRIEIMKENNHWFFQ